MTYWLDLLLDAYLLAFWSWVSWIEYNRHQLIYSLLIGNPNKHATFNKKHNRYHLISWSTNGSTKQITQHKACHPHIRYALDMHMHMTASFTSAYRSSNFNNTSFLLSRYFCGDLNLLHQDKTSYSLIVTDLTFCSR